MTEHEAPRQVEFVPSEDALGIKWWRIMVVVPHDSIPHTAGSITEINRTDHLYPVYRIRYIFEPLRGYTDCPSLDEAKRISTAEVQSRAERGTLITGRPEWIRGMSTL